ncbi:hypothetical protein ScPMuIL_018517 [Solemya velum]
MADIRFFFLLAVATRCAADRGYLLTLPQRVQLNSETKVCATYWGVTNSVSVTLSVNCTSRLYSQLQVHNHEASTCSPLSVPKYLGVGMCELTVEGVVENSDYNFTATHKLVVVDTGVFALIQTDKPLYKPRQTVKFRLFVLTDSLKPASDKLRSVVVEDPNGVRMMQWQNMGTTKGIKSGTFSLSDNPVLGVWKIVAKLGRRRKAVQDFEVKKYVLPKYEIVIKPPSYLTVETKVVSVEICARYAHGEPVKGQLKARVCVQPTQSMAEYNWRRPCISIKKKMNGCHSASVRSSDLGLKSRNYTLFYDSVLYITATVLEEATGKEMTKTSQGPKISRENLQIDLKSFTSSYFKPYLPFEVKARVTRPDDTPVSGKDIAFNIKAHTTDDFGYSSSEYTLLAVTERHHVSQWFSPTHSYLQIQPIRGEIRCGGEVTVDLLYTYTEEFRPAKIFYQLISRGRILASEELLLDRSFVRKETDVNNHVLDAGHMMADIGKNVTKVTNSTEEGQSSDTDSSSAAWMKIFVGYAKFNLEVTAKMIPVSRLLVYYFHASGEVVSDSTSFKVENCFQNQATLRWDREEVHPGHQTTVRISSAPDSLCTIDVVDKKVEFMGGRHLSTDAILERLAGYDVTGGYTAISEYIHCKDKGDLEDRDLPIPALSVPPGPPGVAGPPGSDDSPRGRRQATSYLGFYGSREYVDSILAFKSAGLAVLTNLPLETRPCRDMNGIQGRTGDRLSGPSNSYPGGFDDTDNVDLGTGTVLGTKPPTIRDYFPETWIWTEVPVDHTGAAYVEETIPGTITEWVGHSVCISEELGVGISPTMSVRAFRPFFMSLNLPYSSVRGEQLPLKVSIFNYLSRCLVINIALHESEDFLVVHSPSTANICLCSGNGGSHQFNIEPKSLGIINITVTSEAYWSADKCQTLEPKSNSSEDTDSVVRQLLVEAEGVEQKQMVSSYICLDGKWCTFDLSLDNSVQVVKGSVQGQVSVIGDIMGPALSSLDALIQLPTGCGEQNMLKFSPTAFVVDYLHNTGQLTEDVRTQATDYLKQGYQNELMFQHGDGSYSTFGVSDETGSTWLTAFILKSFYVAKDWIFIDDKNLESSRQWLISKQLPDGSFEQVGKILSKYMQGGYSSVQNTSATLTAFVLVALLESGMPPEDPVVNNAVTWLKDQSMDNTYTMAVAVYALTLYKADIFRDTLWQRLWEISVNEDGMQHWVRNDIDVDDAGSRSRVTAEIEMTAYVLLALLEDNNSETFDTALPIVRWLTKQRNTLGGFVSTQDTVVALQALAKFAKLVYRRGMNITMDIEDNEGHVGHFSVTSANNLLLQSVTLPRVPCQLQVEARGTGCTFIQAFLKYNIISVHGLELPSVFQLFVTPELTKQRHKDCGRRTLGICTSYLGPGGKSNMAVIDIKLVTGWSVEQETLEKLLNANTVRWMKKYEVDEERGYIHIYFEHLDDRQICLHFDISQNTEIANVKPAMVRVYDYYETDYVVTSMYELPPCGKKKVTKTEEKINEAKIPGPKLFKEKSNGTDERLFKKLQRKLGK